MTHIITGLCLRDRGCIDVCPVDCIIPGQLADGWPAVYIDPDTCIDCGAFIPECPFGAIFTEDEVPAAFSAKGGEFINRPGLTGHYEGTNHQGKQVVLTTVRELKTGEIINLRDDIQANYDFFKSGPGYGSKERDDGT
jgi:NAD-dependent dihydropyrimidine dehydrogenase PreA subunit